LPRPSRELAPKARHRADASSKVREMFTQIAPRYDLLNHLLSLQLDRLWRARTARRLKFILDRPMLSSSISAVEPAILLLPSRMPEKPESSGRTSPSNAGSREEKTAGQAPPANQSAASPIPFFEADALRLPFASASFDLVTSAFGFRNLANYEAGLREIQRVLKPGGAIAILEFTEPPEGLWGDFYRWYFAKCCRKLAALFLDNNPPTPTCQNPLPASSVPLNWPRS